MGTKADCASVGEFHDASQNMAGDNFVEMSMSLELGILNTLWRTGGPTSCGLAGHPSTIDHILVPLSGSECVKKVVTCWKLGRKLQLIPAAHPRDHLPVLVLLALRMRRVGQTQQRTRWDFDRIAIALQQGSEERESFLKELDKNLLEQDGKFEITFTALAADGSWELWIQTMVVTGKKFFSHTKALHTTEETRRANFERWDLLRRRQRLRQQLGETAAKVDAHSQEPWTARRFRIRELGEETTGCIKTSAGKGRGVCACRAPGGSPTGCKGQSSQTVCTAGKELERSERQALHFPVAGSGEKLVGVTCSGRWNVCKKSS